MEDAKDKFISGFSVILYEKLGSNATGIITELKEYVSNYDITNRETGMVVYEGYIPEWLSEYFVSKCIGGCKDNSMKDYALHLKTFFDFLRIPIDEITEGDIQKYLGYCMKVKHNSNGYVEHKRIVICDFMKWSYDKGYIKKNPSAFIPVIHSARTSRVPYTDDELAVIRNEVTDVRDKAIIETLISTGCRVTELCRLDVRDVNFYTNELRLFGKGDKYRTSYMNAEMKHALQKYLNSRKDDNPALFVTKKKGKISKEFDRVTKQGIEALMRKLSDKLGVDEIQPHKFRRYTATLLNKSGCDLIHIQRFLGHSSPNVTARYIYGDDDDVKNLHQKYVR